MAFIVNMKNERGDPETIGVIRAVSDADNNEAEFAIIVRSDMQRKGIGRKLMEKLVTYCNTRGTRRLVGRTLVDNKAMQNEHVKEAFGLTGEYDLLLKLKFNGIDEFNDFVLKFRKEQQIESTLTMVVTANIKEELN